MELWRRSCTLKCAAPGLRFPLLPPEPSQQSWDEVPGAPSAATLVKLKLRPPNTFLIVSRKRRKVVFGPSGGWGIVPLTQSHSPYLHDKSWSQEKPQAPSCGGLYFFSPSIYSFLYQHHVSSIRGKWRNHSSNLDLVQHAPWETGQGIASVPVTCLYLHLTFLNEKEGRGFT